MKKVKVLKKSQIFDKLIRLSITQNQWGQVFGDLALRDPVNAFCLRISLKPDHIFKRPRIPIVLVIGLIIF